MLWQIFCLIVYFVRLVFDTVIDAIFERVYRKDVSLPDIRERFLAESASSLADKIRNKKLTSEEVVRSYIKRLQDVNCMLNAIVDERFESAITEAKVVDDFLSKSNFSEKELKDKTPFLGVPFTTKESNSCKGMSFTCGLISRAGLKAEEDAEVVSLMKNSGAILIAVTNVPELDMWWETRNKIKGQTCNPYDLNRITGGSSGGEASIVAACGSPLGLGTDIGGSVRLASHFCGTFGHKPTSGIVPMKGLLMRTNNEGKSICTAGTVTRFSEDIIPFLKAIANTNVSQLNLDERVDLCSIQVHYVLEPGDLKVSSVSLEQKIALMKAISHLVKATRKPAKEANIKEFRFSHSIWKYAMAKENSNFSCDLSNNAEAVTLKKEVPRLLIGQSLITFASILRLIDLNVLPVIKENVGEKVTTELTETLNKLLQDNGVLLFPCSPSSAPYHYMPFFRPYNFAYSGVFNALHLPVTYVPLGRGCSDLPVGVQVVASQMNDRLTIAVATELERAFGGWTPPFRR